VVWFEQRLVVPVDSELWKEIFDEAHLFKFSIHPGSTKMYQDLRKKLLVVKHEGRHSQICGRVWYLSSSQSQPFEISRCTSTVDYTFVELGWHRYGFYCGFTPDRQKKGLYLGYSRLIDQDCSFHHSDTTYWRTETANQRGGSEWVPIKILFKN
jgi:hypothetical protein